MIDEGHVLCTVHVLNLSGKYKTGILFSVYMKSFYC